MKYVDAIRQAIFDSMQFDSQMMILGQGVWSPFYVGSSMDGIESAYGRDRVLDTPVSENAVTGIGVGLALSGVPTLVIHPRIDFMLYAMDPLVNSAAKWRYSLSLNISMPLTVRAIINRGGEQGAQHSQALHSWFAHVPGLRVLMPSKPSDAYLMLKGSIFSPDPVIFVEDRWDYEEEEEFDVNDEIPEVELLSPNIEVVGSELTVVGIGHTTNLAKKVLSKNSQFKSKIEIIDLRVLNPIDITLILESVRKTGKLLVIDGAWSNCGMAAEIIAQVSEKALKNLLKPPKRLTLVNSPAPTSRYLEENYFIKESDVTSVIEDLLT